MTDEPARVIEYDRFRRTTARMLTESVTTKPQVTLHRTVDVGPLESGLARAKSHRPAERLGFTPALLAAVARGISGGRLNGVVTDRRISLYDSVDLGVAVDVDGALVVPVIRKAESLSVAAIGEELARLAALAREKKLRTEHVCDATFTVSSLGAFGVELFSPIVNPPQLAILGVGKVRDELDLVDGEVITRRRLGLSLSFDHAATDGAAAARALGELSAVIEQPSALQWSCDATHRAPEPARSE